MAFTDRELAAQVAVSRILARCAHTADTGDGDATSLQTQAAPLAQTPPVARAGRSPDCAAPRVGARSAVKG